MKRIILLAGWLLLVIPKNAQNNLYSERINNIEKYFCTICDYYSAESGNCPIHKVALVQVGRYYCPSNDGITSDKPGRCIKDNRVLVLMVDKSAKVQAPPNNKLTVDTLQYDLPK